MKQLSGLDSTFLYMETPTTFGHVTGLMIFDRPSRDYHPLAAVYAKYASLVGELEPLRRRLVEVPFGLDHPYWVVDPKLDLDFHIREIHLAKPGMVDQLADQVSRIVGRPMDRTRPLWEVYVIDGLHSGRWALLTKYHHATIDGAAGQLMLKILTDPDVDAPPPGGGPLWVTEPLPSTVDLLRRTAVQLARNPFEAMRVQARLLSKVADVAGLSSVSGATGKAGAAVKAIARLGHGPRTSLPTTQAPRTPWNKSITGHRRFAMRTTSLDNIKALKNATGGTVNDIVMAICAGGLRQYLLAHDALPDRPLRAMVPVSTRTGEEDDPWTNRVSALLADLPTDCADPLERIARCSQAMQKAKRTLDMVPAEELVDLTQFSAPMLATSAVRLASRLRLADRFAPPFNLVISNVPGPRQPVYLAGAQLSHQFPVSIVTDGQGLNITVVSYLDRLDFGFIVDRDLV
ncbi:MAG: WS/DGAT/MGAT family O-acyltransferase, partial [Mycobacterium sp.]